MSETLPSLDPTLDAAAAVPAAAQQPPAARSVTPSSGPVEEEGLNPAAAPESGRPRGDRLAAGRAAARSLGLPEPVADLDPDEIVGLARTSNHYRLLSQSPHLRGWLQEGNNEELAGDDVETLADLEQLGVAVARAQLVPGSFWQGLTRSFVSGAVNAVGMGFQGLGNLAIPSAEGLKEVRSHPGFEFEPVGALGPFFGEGYSSEEAFDLFQGSLEVLGPALVDVGEATEDFAAWIDVPEEQRTFAHDVAGGLGQFAGQLALFLGGPAGQAALTGLLFGQAVEVQRRLQIEAGVDPNDADAQVAQFVGGVMGLLLDRFSLKVLTKRLPSLDAYLGRHLAGAVKGGAVEGTQEMTEAVLQRVIVNAVAEQDIDLLTGLWRDGLVGGNAGALLGLLREAMTPGRGRGAQLAPSPQPGEERAIIQAMNAKVKESKLAERSPEAFKDFVGRTVEGQGFNHLYVSAEAFVSYFRSKGEEPGAVAQRLGLEPGRVALAARAGGRIAIPTEAYAAELAGGAHGGWFADNATLSPWSMRPQAESAAASAKAARAREEAFQQAETAELLEIEQEITRQFVDAGVPEGAAQQTVQLLVAYYRTLGRESYESPMDLFKRFGGLEVIGPTPDLAKLSAEDLARRVAFAQWKHLNPSVEDREIRVRNPDEEGHDDDLITYANPLPFEGGPYLDEVLEEPSTDQQGGDPDEKSESIEEPSLADLNWPRRNSPVAFLNGRELEYHGKDDEKLRSAALHYYKHKLSMSIDEDGNQIKGNAHKFDKDGNPLTEVQNITSGLKIKFEIVKKINQRQSNAQVRLRMIPALPEILAHGTIQAEFDPNFDREKPSKKNVLGHYWIEADVMLGDRIYRVGVIIRLKTDGTFFYDVTVPDKLQSANILLPQPIHTPSKNGAGLSPEDVGSLNMALEAGNFNLFVLGVVNSATGQRRTPGFRGALFTSSDGADSEHPTRLILTEEANLSTALHELGHYFLETSKAFTTSPVSPLRVHENLSVAKEWWLSNADSLAVEADVPQAEVEAFLQGDLSPRNDVEQKVWRGMHEQWARAFEAYLREGKAPSEGLKQSFRHFKDWLLAIYRREEALGVTLSPEIRGVFDHMLATREEIDRAMRNSGYRAAGNPRLERDLQNLRADAEEDLLAARLAGDEEEEGVDAALRALHGQAALAYLVQEIEDLSPEGEPVRGPASAPGIAERIAEGWTAREMDESIYLAVQAEAGRAAAAALAAGDRLEALRQRQRQLINHHLWIKAREKRLEMRRVQDLIFSAREADLQSALPSQQGSEALPLAAR